MRRVLGRLTAALIVAATSMAIGAQSTSATSLSVYTVATVGPTWVGWSIVVPPEGGTVFVDTADSGGGCQPGIAFFIYNPPGNGNNDFGNGITSHVWSPDSK